MSNPQTQLYKMLAESSLRARHISSIHAQHTSTIPQRQQAIADEMQQLREQIYSAGIGGNVDAEDRYMELLEHQGYLDDSWEMRPATPEATQPEAIPSELQKAIAYGEMLVSVYGGGALVKGASADLGYWADFLGSMPYDRALQASKKLQELVLIVQNFHRE